MEIHSGGEIKVAVVFSPGGAIRPVWFEWRNRRHQVEETTYRWQARRGAALLLHFAVREGRDLYELVYNTADQIWNLRAIEVG